MPNPFFEYPTLTHPLPDLTSAEDYTSVLSAEMSVSTYILVAEHSHRPVRGLRVSMHLITSLQTQNTSDLRLHHGEISGFSTPMAHSREARFPEFPTRMYLNSYFRNILAIIKFNVTPSPH